MKEYWTDGGLRMSTAVFLIYVSALAAGVVHTLLGPDHYAPFIALAKARNWPLRKALGITLVCGVAHIASAVVLAVLAARFAGFLESFDFVEELRAQAAAWALTAFGFAYAVWGLRRAVRPAAQRHSSAAAQEKSFIPIVLFIIFALGPCEPLVPVYMAAAAGQSASAGGSASLAFSFPSLISIVIFGAGTLATMSAVVGLSLGAFKKLSFPAGLSRFSHVLAGSVMGSCGLAMTFLGL